MDLVDAGVPADQGLSSLGLLMQLGGHVLGAIAVFLFALALLVGGARGTTTLWIFAIFASSCMRSMFQLAAGKQLVFGEAGTIGGRLTGMRRYITIAIVQSVAVAAIAKLALDASIEVDLGILAGLLVWPVTLGVLMRLPRFARFDADMPIAEDKGFEGASILMTVLGLTGAGGTLLLLSMLFRMPGNELQRGPNILVLLSVIMLFVRSVLHVHAGLSGLRTTSLDQSVEAANRYANFGVISSFCAGGALLLYAMASGTQVMGIAIVCGVCWLLIAWPIIVRRFFADRQFADLLAGGTAPVHRRAPDAGLTWLGWLLIALAAWSASFLIPNFAFGNGSDVAQLVLAFGGNAGDHSLWWSVGLVVLEGWAGFELVRMSPHSKIIATVYGAVSVAVTLYLEWPTLSSMTSHGTSSWDSNPGFIVMFGAIAISIILPVATIVLVQRKIAPAARARFREKPASP
ncbi:MAG TPA: hypothetical protein VGG74_17455 [Kofleriaceae bacterium]